MNSRILSLCVFPTLILGCHRDLPKVRKQKAVFFAVYGGDKRMATKEIERVMQKGSMATPGLAMVDLLDRSIVGLPKVEGMVNAAFAKSGMSLPPPDPALEAEERAKVGRQVAAMVHAREIIALIEQEQEPVP